MTLRDFHKFMKGFWQKYWANLFNAQPSVTAASPDRAPSYYKTHLIRKTWK